MWGRLAYTQTPTHVLFLAATLTSNDMATEGAEGANGAGDSRDPSGFLSEIIGAPVTVKLNSGVVYKGA